jgi:hypothetical protein
MIENIKLFNEKIPPFILKNITYEEWKIIKKESIDFKDIYIDCPNDTIIKLYKEKNCKYIQISEYGLYYLEEDICNFGVPQFICDQHLRIRIKIHNKCTTRGFCSLSVTILCKPKCIKKLSKSIYSLDNINKLPLQLIYTS